MKYTIQWLLVLLTVLNPIISRAALTDFDRQELAFKNWLAPYNSGFESGKAKWTASGGTFTAVTSGSNLLDGKGSFTWDASASGQTLTSQAITVPNGGFGLDCEVEILVQVPSGTATHYVRAFDGTNPIAYQSIISSTTPRWNAVTFPCPSSGTVALQFYANADEPLIAGDLGYVGRSKRVGSTDLITEPVAYTPVYTGFGTVTNSTARSWRVGSYLFVESFFTIGTATGVEAQMTLGFSGTSGNVTTASNLPTLSIAGHCSGDTASVTNFGNITILQEASKTYVTFGRHTSGQSGLTKNNGNAFNNSVNVSCSFRVPIQGWAASTVVMPNAQGWYVDANISGANPSLGTSNVSSYTEITNGSLTMTPRTGSAAAGIMCSSTNAAATPTTSTSTCSAGSESLGLNAVIPVSGAYEVCADFSHYMEADQAEGINTAFQIVQTPTNAQTITTEGGSRKSGRNAPLAIASGTAQAINVPYTVCGIFQLSAGTNGFRLMYEQLVTGTPNGSEVLTDELSTVGQRNLRFTIKPVNSQQQAILANSVSSGAGNGIKMDAARIANAGSASINSQTSDMVSSVSWTSTGRVSVTLKTGYFSSSPYCFCTTYGSDRMCSNQVSSATSVSVATANAAGVSDTDFYFWCVGPR